MEMKVAKPQLRGSLRVYMITASSVVMWTIYNNLPLCNVISCTHDYLETCRPCKIRACERRTVFQRKLSRKARKNSNVFKDQVMSYNCQKRYNHFEICLLKKRTNKYSDLIFLLCPVKVWIDANNGVG